jgi:coatomer protein complex subunit alpha (xenin)
LPLFLALYQGASTSLPGIAFVPSLKSALQRNLPQDRLSQNDFLPKLCLKVPYLIEKLKTGYKSFQAGKFSDVREQFDYILRAIPLTVAESRSECNELKELLDVSREYITAVRIKVASAEETSPVRTMELAAYFTHCNLQPAHLLLALRMAMVSAFKYKNFITTASFAQRLLELPDLASERNADLRDKAQKILQKSQQMARNEYELNYDERTPFVMDCVTLTPIYRGTAAVKCPYCSSSYSPSFNKSVCQTCQLSEIGVETLGLVTTSTTALMYVILLEFVKEHSLIASVTSQTENVLLLLLFLTITLLVSLFTTVSTSQMETVHLMQVLLL